MRLARASAPAREASQTLAQAYHSARQRAAPSLLGGPAALLADGAQFLAPSRELPQILKALQSLESSTAAALVAAKVRLQGLDGPVRGRVSDAAPGGAARRTVRGGRERKGACGRRLYAREAGNREEGGESGDVGHHEGTRPAGRGRQGAKEDEGQGQGNEPRGEF